jgi:hypothetical protein
MRTHLDERRVRYYACESLYNIAKVSREGFVVFFSEAFDAMFRLCADRCVRKWGRVCVWLQGRLRGRGAGACTW